MKVQKISSSQTFDLRMRILRPGQAAELCHYPEDDFPETFHLGILQNEKVICVGTFLQQAQGELDFAKHPYRLRGMATELFYQRQGLGRQLIEAALLELAVQKCDLLWFNARISASEFYQKLGFISLKRIFEIPLIGAHKVMYKKLPFAE